MRIIFLALVIAFVGCQEPTRPSDHGSEKDNCSHDRTDKAWEEF